MHYSCIQLCYAVCIQLGFRSSANLSVSEYIRKVKLKQLMHDKFSLIVTVSVKTFYVSTFNEL